MKVGDLVRYRKERWPRKNDTDCGIWDWKLCVLIKYQVWEKIATILCDGKLVRVASSEVTLAGREDEEVLDGHR